MLKLGYSSSSRIEYASFTNLDVFIPFNPLILKIKSFWGKRLSENGIGKWDEDVWIRGFLKG